MLQVNTHSAAFFKIYKIIGIPFLILLFFQIFCTVFTIFVAILQNFAEEYRFSIFLVKFSEKFLGISQKFKDFDKGYSKIIIFQSNLRNLLNFRRNSMQIFVSHRFQKSGDWDTVSGSATTDFRMFAGGPSVGVARSGTARGRLRLRLRLLAVPRGERRALLPCGLRRRKMMKLSIYP